MIHSSRLIILATTKVGEKALVLHTLSAEWGRRSFIVNIGRSTSAALFLPLNILDAEIIENPKSELWRLRSLAAVHPLGGIRSNVHKNTMTLFMSEVLFRTLRDGANEEGLFDWLCRSLMTLDALQSDFANYHLRWLLEFAAALGFSPSPEDLAPFAGEHFASIKTLLQSGFADCMLLPLSGVARNEIADILLQYIGYHAEARIDVRSLAVLRELYA